MLTVAAPAAVSDTLAPVGAVTNGALETPFIPEVVPDALEGTALDACYGIGHQVQWGTDSPQHALVGTDPYNPEDADPDPARLAERYTSEERPISKAEEDAQAQAGPDTCVFGKEEGYDLVWQQPKMSAEKPLHWSFHAPDPSVEFGYGFDDDPFDREARFLTEGEGSAHNLWQAYPSKHQAFTANFDALEFAVEDGDIADASTATVKISLSSAPVHHTSSTFPIEIDCVLTFKSSEMASHVGGDGVMSMSPLDAAFGPHGNDPDCPMEAWNAAPDEDGKRSVLGQLRIVQLSFWNWNSASEPIVVDDIALPGATLFAEEVASGNAAPS